MKVIIPLAGKGTRLRPHTHITPKPMLRIGGKPVIDYVMDDLQKLGGHVVRRTANGGEYYRTEAFQYMVDKGAKVKVEDVEGWDEAGKLDTLIETNRILLEKRKMARRPKGLSPDAKIVEPVYIED